MNGNRGELGWLARDASDAADRFYANERRRVEDIYFKGKNRPQMRKPSYEERVRERLAQKSKVTK